MIMYCAREDDTWYCVEDDVYTQMYTPGVETGIEIFKKNGKEYFINSEGKYEIKDKEV